jgi:hypothetical protein
MPDDLAAGCIFDLQDLMRDVSKRYDPVDLRDARA